MKRLFIITGDASGDIHGSYVVRQLQTLSPDTEVRAIGGAAMEATGIPLFYDQRQMGALGGAIFQAIPSHLMLGYRLLEQFETWRPDAVLLIDYGMFNLWMARHLKKRGIPVFYYIPPQVWASRRGRIKTIQRYVDHVFCIFPFEKPLYDAAGIPATYVGHPLVEELPPPPDRTDFCHQHGLNPDLPIIGLFPGSRRSELRGLLKPMLEALPHIESLSGKRYQFVIAQSPALPAGFFRAEYAALAPLTQNLNLTVLENQNYQIMALSHALLASSGTTTLEAALYGVPTVIAYPLSWLAYTCFKRMAYVNFIGLPNILASKPFLPELLRHDANPEAMAHAILPFLDDNAVERQTALAEFEQIQQALGQHTASGHVAQTLLNLLNECPVQT